MDHLYKIYPRVDISGILPNNKRINKPTVLPLNRKEFFKCMAFGEVYACIGKKEILIKELDFDKAEALFKDNETFSVKTDSKIFIEPIYVDPPKSPVISFSEAMTENQFKEDELLQSKSINDENLEKDSKDEESDKDLDIKKSEIESDCEEEKNSDESKEDLNEVEEIIIPKYNNKRDTQHNNSRNQKHQNQSSSNQKNRSNK